MLFRSRRQSGRAGELIVRGFVRGKLVSRNLRAIVITDIGDDHAIAGAIHALAERALLLAGCQCAQQQHASDRSEEHTSELQSLMRISSAVFSLKKKKHIKQTTPT